MGFQKITLNHADFELEVQSSDEGPKKLFLRTTENNPVEIPEHLRSCETMYDLQLIETIFIQKKLWTCDEIRRDVEPGYVENLLNYTITCHIPDSQFNGKEILDFGCGAGASTMILKRLFPQTRITGIDMDPDLLKLARERARFYGYDDINFILSNDPVNIPIQGIKFDHIVMNAVYEHLLKRERKFLFPSLWQLLKQDGIIFINETPNRWFKNEMHTTHLDWINYMPAFLAFRVVKKKWGNYSGESWQRLLRDGIRGGSAAELKRIFRKKRCPVKILEPSRLGIHNRLDLFYKVYSLEQHIGNKDYQLKYWLMKYTGIIDTSALILAVQKTSV